VSCYVVLCDGGASKPFIDVQMKGEEAWVWDDRETRSDSRIVE